MPHKRAGRTHLPGTASVVLFLSLPLALMSCQTGSGVESAPEPERVVGETVAYAGTAVRLDSAEAGRLSAEIRQEVSVRLAEGLDLSLWASERLLIDPHALSVDDSGRVYVFGSTRSPTQRALSEYYRKGLASTVPYQTVLPHQTVDELRAFLRRDLAPEQSAKNDWLRDLNEDGSHDWRDLTVQKERVYRIQDTNGDGRADLSQVIAEDFNTEVTDIAGGILVHDNDVFTALAPDVWRLRDTSGDGVIDSRRSISHGYGPRLSFYFAHGMSGVTMGPDGRIYWSVGDIGLSVVDQQGRRWSYPNQGAIMRANPDGSDFEVFAAGLRNVYEFAFDEYGNLISADNDADNRGENERLVYIVNGSDSGWRSNLHWGKYTDPINNRYKTWMDEGLFRPRFPGQAAYITPPISLYHSGPAGMAYNPGTALSERWRNHFFIAMDTKIYAFRLRAKGAGFELARDTVLVDGLLTTSMDFGPDGALYLADLMVKRKAAPAGRIWKLDASGGAASGERTQTQTLLASDFRRRTEADLAGLLSHADMRVRLKAQFALAERRATRTLLAAARRSGHQLARLHGLWGIGQLARRDRREAAPLTALLRDHDPEVRAQAAKVIGEAAYAPAGEALVPLLQDGSSRVRFFAAQALGQIGHRPAVRPLIAMLESNDDADAYLRHAGTLALARIGEAESVVALAGHDSRALRLAAVVALRRMRHPEVTRFLRDSDEHVVTEAARAVNDDGGIEAGLPDLARLLETDRFTNEPLVRRAINANLRLGTAEAARRVVDYAARTATAESMRVEAIAVLGVWPKPSPYDRVDGMERTWPERDPEMVRAAVAPLVEPMLKSASPAVKTALVQALARLSAHASAPALRERVSEDDSPAVRFEALKALHAMRAERMDETVRVALADRDPSVRRTAIELIPELKLPDATTVRLLVSVLARGSIEERQSAFGGLGRLRSPDAHEVLGRSLDELAAGTLAPELHLDLVEAVETSEAPALRSRLERFQGGRSEGERRAGFRAALRGGSAARGRQVVFQEPAQCTACHSFGDGGSTVGPELSRIGSRLGREQLLEALVEPSARIAPGFGAAGAPSPMPPMGQLLSIREIRDVVEYLSTLR